MRRTVPAPPGAARELSGSQKAAALGPAALCGRRDCVPVLGWPSMRAGNLPTLTDESGDSLRLPLQAVSPVTSGPSANTYEVAAQHSFPRKMRPLVVVSAPRSRGGRYKYQLTEMPYGCATPSHVVVDRWSRAVHSGPHLQSHTGGGKYPLSCSGARWGGARMSSNVINWVQEVLHKEGTSLQERFKITDTGDQSTGFGCCITDLRTLGKPCLIKPGRARPPQCPPPPRSSPPPPPPRDPAASRAASHPFTPFWGLAPHRRGLRVVAAAEQEGGEAVRVPAVLGGVAATGHPAPHQGSRGETEAEAGPRR